MTRRMRAVRRVVCGVGVYLGLTVGIIRAAEAGLITTVSQDVEFKDGLYEYKYEVINESQSASDVYAFAVALNESAQLESIASPTEWEPLYSWGATAIEWDTGFAPISPGSAVVFGFSSSEAPSSTFYQVTGFDIDAFQFYTNTGATSGPSAPAAVPEPSTGVSLAIGGALVMIGRFRRRSNKRV